MKSFRASRDSETTLLSHVRAALLANYVKSQPLWDSTPGKNKQETMIMGGIRKIVCCMKCLDRRGCGAAALPKQLQLNVGLSSRFGPGLPPSAVSPIGPTPQVDPVRQVLEKSTERVSVPWAGLPFRPKDRKVYS